MGFPVLFIDGASGISWGNGVAKFYVFRTDPEFNIAKPPVNTPVAQVVIPINGFVTLAAFFNQVVKTLAENGSITSEQLELISSPLGKPSA